MTSKSGKSAEPDCGHHENHPNISAYRHRRIRIRRQAGRCADTLPHGPPWHCAERAVSDKISKDLKKRGFKFVGSTVVYAHMQATGMVDDHVAYCWKRN